MREIQYYSFSRKGDTNKPEDGNDHLMDAMGYVIHTTFNMVQGLAKKDNAPQAEIMTPFWAKKHEQGIYKGKGKLEDRRTNNFADFFEGDGWLP